jgi:hypothetical protein
MQRSQSPIEAVQAQVLREPVLQLVFALQQVSAGSCCEVLARLQSTHCVEALDIADMIVDGEAHLARRVSDATAARPRNKRHVCNQSAVW